MEITNDSNFNIKEYLDSTYLKSAEQAGVSEEQNRTLTQDLVKEAMLENYKLAMILPQYVAMARNMLFAEKSNTLLGTVIDFPDGKAKLEDKLTEAATAILDGADELDFVINYDAFRFGDAELVADEILQCSRICLVNNRAVKWIIETAALNNDEIAAITKLIAQVIIDNFDQKDYRAVFVKSSTGFFSTEKDVSNGATPEAIATIANNVGPLQIKASGGIKTKEQALQMIHLGASRIGTSSAKAIAAS